MWSEGCSDWQPLSSVPGLSTDAPPQDATHSGFHMLLAISFLNNKSKDFY